MTTSSLVIPYPMISNGKLNPRVPSPSRQRECSPFHLLSVSSRQEPLRCLGSQTILKSGHLKPGGRTCRSKLTKLRSPLLSCWINSRRQMRTPFPLILSKGLCRPSPLTRLTLQARYGARLRPSRKSVGHECLAMWEKEDRESDKAQFFVAFPYALPLLR